MRLSLHFLPAFCAVARSNNLREAAEQLHLTHSAVSQQIRQLEDELGLPLFDRPGRGIRLNANGQCFLSAVEPALRSIERAAQEARDHLASSEQRLSVSVLPSFAQRWLLPRMALWRTEHPDIHLHLHTSQQLMDLHGTEFHAGVRQGDGQWKGLMAKRLFDSPWVVLGSPAAAQRLRDQPLKRWLDEPLLGNAQRWNEWFASQHLATKVRPVASFVDAGLMLQAAEQDIGIALSRELLAADAIARGSLVRLSTMQLQVDDAQAYWLAYRPELADWPPIAAFYEWLIRPQTARPVLSAS